MSVVKGGEGGDAGNRGRLQRISGRGRSPQGSEAVTQVEGQSIDGGPLGRAHVIVGHG